MAKYEIVTKMFDDKSTGNVVPYDRFVVSGYVFGKERKVELKVDKNQLEMISLIMDSVEEKPIIETRKANETEMDDFLELNS